MAVFLILRITGTLLMAMLVCALSELLCRYLPVFGTVIVLTLLPAFCVGFGISAAELSRVFLRDTSRHKTT